MNFTISTLFFALAFLLKFSWDANAGSNFKMEECSLDKGEVLTIGCTKDCGRFNTWGLNRAARRMKYKIKTVNIYSENTTPDFSKVDGILIPGGVDIDPKYYLDSIPQDLQDHTRSLDHLVGYSEDGKKRDPFEYNLIKQYFASTDTDTIYTPILGICRGMQMLTVAQGIPLYVDIREELGIKNRRYTLDKIRITKKDSIMSSIQRRSKFRAVENHHQGLRVDYYEKNKKNWPHLEVTAVSNGGKVAEALEFLNRPVLGVQFHPEYTFGKTRRVTFSWLLNRACIKKNIAKGIK